MAGPSTRIAPTPSGLLHAGNAWSFLIAWLCARSRGGAVHLRIDDLDAARSRREYLDDIFASLAWLGLDWDTGPRDAGEFLGDWSQRLRLAEYRAALETLRDGRAVYPCACGREQVRRDAAAAGFPGRYAGTCRHAALDASLAAFPGEAARPGEARGGSLPLRARVPSNAQVTLAIFGGGSEILAPGRETGDFVVWRKDGLPAYQLASVVDDEALGIDCVVRGSDLRPSSGVQVWLAERIGAGAFPNAAFLHHPLLLGPGGGKLSKSAGSESLRALRERGGPQALLRGFAAWMGMDPAGVGGVRDLLAGFAPERLPKEDRSWPEFASAWLG